jgi:hypothetical protein
MGTGRGNQSTRRKSTWEPLYRSQILHELTWDWTRAAALRICPELRCGLIPPLWTRRCVPPCRQQSLPLTPCTKFRDCRFCPPGRFEFEWGSIITDLKFEINFPLSFSAVILSNGTRADNDGHADTHAAIAVWLGALWQFSSSWPKQHSDCATPALFPRPRTKWLLALP